MKFLVYFQKDCGYGWNPCVIFQKILEKIISDNTATIYKNILVQFHKNVPKYEKRRDAIQEKLSETHELIFNYPFIFEGWQIKK